MTTKEAKKIDQRIRQLQRARTMLEEVRDIAESIRHDEHELQADISTDTSTVAEMNTQLLSSAISMLETAQNYITMVGTNIATYDKTAPDTHQQAGIMLENYVTEVLRENGFGLMRTSMHAQMAKRLVECFNATDDSAVAIEQQEQAKAQSLCIAMTANKLRLS